MPLTERQWQAVQALDGQQLQTPGTQAPGSGKPFTVRKRSDGYVEALPASSSYARPIRRGDFDYALSLGVEIPNLRPGMLQSAMQTGSYVVGILRELHQRGDF